MSGKQDDEKAKAAASLVDRIGGVRTLATLMPKLTRPILGRRGFAEASVITEWATIVGTELAASSQPEKLQFPGGERVSGVLHVRVSGGTATELLHLEPQIVERINGHFGYRAVRKLKLVHVPPAKFADSRQKSDTGATGGLQENAQAEFRQLDEIEHTEMRNALEKLGRAIAARNRG